MKDLIIAFRGAFLYLDILVIFCDFVNDEPGFVDVSWGSKSVESSNAILRNGDSIAFRELEMLAPYMSALDIIPRRKLNMLELGPKFAHVYDATNRHVDIQGIEIDRTLTIYGMEV